jgi:predicted DCC family thiol-disulfide oxidoreductase YuxK
MGSQAAIELPPLLIYDAACGFCRRWVERWKARTGARVAYAPLQRRGLLRRLRIPRADAGRAIQLVDQRGRRSEGARAVFLALARAPGLRGLASLGLLPGLRSVAKIVYQLIARHRTGAARVDHWLLGDRRAVPSTRYVRWLYLRGLGLIFFAAFESLDRQALGLFGARGIRPIATLLESVREQLGREAYRLLPTVFWLDASDESLKAVGRAGKLVSIALVLNLAPRLCLLTLWALYLSFVSVGGPFLSLQWDALLLESGFQGALVAPGGLAPGVGCGKPNAVSVLLMRWLAFRLHFESGLAKWQSGDETWRKATACSYYYETAPLPTALGWRVHHLPPRVNQIGAVGTLLIEGVASWLALGPRRFRRWCFGAFGILQAAITATGNYGFFNLLALNQALWLLDDEDLVPSRARAARPTRESLAQRVWTTVGGLPLLLLTGARLRSRLFNKALGDRTRRLSTSLAPFDVANTYGLFSVMTTSRPEIIIEGSNDGLRWLPFEFKYKPGDPRRRPAFIVPHMPRLDWLLWFAALQSPPRWFLGLLAQLLNGSPEVLALLKTNPFGEHPPRFIRARLYDYRMTDRATQRRTGAWWRRELLGTYVPAVQAATSGDHVYR